jgi:hypothetical protein
MHEPFLQPSPYEAGNGNKTANFVLWENKQTGEIVEGLKAYHNDKKRRFNLEISPVRICSVKFSIPKIHNGSNYYPVGKDETRAVIRAVEGYLKEAGVHCNVEEARISRLDSFRNIVTEGPCLAYYRLLQSLRIKRTEQILYATSILWRNQQQQFAVYDKVQEMRSKGLDVSAYPVNTLRFEQRLLKGRKVKDSLGVETIEELLRD